MTTQVRTTLLDELMPVFEFADVQSRVIRATPRQIFTAAKELTLAEIGAMRPLFWLRALPERFGRERAEDLPPGDTPFLDLALGPDSPWILLGDEPGQEFVLGAVGAFAQPRLEYAEIRTPADFVAPIAERHGRTALSIRVVPGGDVEGGYTTTMESRTHFPAAAARRRFAWYWRGIHPFEALMVRQTLEATRRRAEQAAAAS